MYPENDKKMEDNLNNKKHNQGTSELSEIEKSSIESSKRIIDQTENSNEIHAKDYRLNITEGKSRIRGLWSGVIKHRSIVLGAGGIFILFVVAMGYVLFSNDTGNLNNLSVTGKTYTDNSQEAMETDANESQLKLAEQARVAKDKSEAELDRVIISADTELNIVYDSGNKSACYKTADAEDEAEIVISVLQQFSGDETLSEEKYEDAIKEETAQREVRTVGTCVLDRQIVISSSVARAKDDFNKFFQMVYKQGYESAEKLLDNFAISQHGASYKLLGTEKPDELIVMPKTQYISGYLFQANQSYTKYTHGRLPLEVDIFELLPANGEKSMLMFEMQNVYFSAENIAKGVTSFLDRDMMYVPSLYGDNTEQLYENLSWKLYKPKSISLKKGSLILGSENPSFRIKNLSYEVAGYSSYITLNEFENSQLVQRFIKVPGLCNFEAAKDLVINDTNSVVKKETCSEAATTKDGIKIYENSKNATGPAGSEVTLVAIIGETIVLYEGKTTNFKADRGEIVAGHLRQFKLLIEDFEEVDKAEYYTQYD